MRVLLSFLGVLFFFDAFAQKKYIPKSINDSGKKYVFVDVIRSEYNILFDVKNKKTEVVSRIEFESSETGYPILDFVPDASSIVLNGKNVQSQLISIPDTKVRGIQSKVQSNQLNSIIIKTQLPSTKFLESDAGVSEFFYFHDLHDRWFLERYIPSSFEYDQTKIRFNVKIINSDVKHKIMTNGKVVEVSFNEYLIDYPEFYSSSSIFFHLRPENTLNIKSKDYKSINSRKINVRIYTVGERAAVSDNYFSEVFKYLKEIERDYGPYPHESLLIWDASTSHAMEYAGAARTSIWAMRHELDHLWFARKIIPNNGNSGWIDESIATWGDFGYYKGSSSEFNYSIGTATSSEYRRSTNAFGSYSEGARFLADLSFYFEDEGGLKPFLGHYFLKRDGKVSSNKDFIQELNLFFETDISDIFWKVVGKSQSDENSLTRRIQMSTDNNFHQLLSEEEMFKQK